MNSEKLMASGTRLYYLDWLRVIAFGLLVFYHAGLIFVDWGYHIQNDKLSENFKLPLLFMNQWRIPLLFFVSGAGVKFALGNKRIGSFMKERFTRLFIPLVFGILVVIPPQVYFERLSQHQFSGSFLNFYPEFFKGVYPEGNFTWNHLWFLAYLFVFVIIALPLIFYFNSINGEKLIKKLVPVISGKTGVLLLLVLLLLTEYFLRDKWPDTRNLISDWYNFVFYFITFLSGYFIASAEKIWDTIEKNRKVFLFLGITSFCVIYFGWHRNGVNFLETTHYGNLIFKFFKCLNILSWIFCGIGFAKKYLNFTNRFLQYANKAVYPFYILHQTVIICIGYYVIQLRTGISIKYCIIVFSTYLITLLIYDLVIRRIKWIKPFFGLK